jgi:potassium-transporting ATPase KdpC subunit
LSNPNSVWRTLRPVVLLALISMLVCGLAYPLVITGVSQVIFPHQADGSLVQLGNRTVGSHYIDNGFTLPIFFHARNESNPQTVSASGVDPDITVQDALTIQVPRIHNATGIPISSLNTLVMDHEQWTLGVAGDPYVNVLDLNLALISSYPTIYSSYS